MPRVDLVDAGFFPKEVVVPGEWLAAPGVERIASVSTCISGGPSGWIEHWKHNALGLFASPALARSVVAAAEADRFEIHGYRLATIALDEGRIVASTLEPGAVSPIPKGAERLGYDAVGRDLGDFFDCSPLSCNRGAAEFRANRWCLLDTVDEAIHAATRFSSEDWEPGVYYVVEVWRIGSSRPPRTAL